MSTPNQNQNQMANAMKLNDAQKRMLKNLADKQAKKTEEELKAEEEELKKREQKWKSINLSYSQHTRLVVAELTRLFHGVEKFLDEDLEGVFGKNGGDKGDLDTLLDTAWIQFLFRMRTTLNPVLKELVSMRAQLMDDERMQYGCLTSIPERDLDELTSSVTARIMESGVNLAKACLKDN